MAKYSMICILGFVLWTPMVPLSAAEGDTDATKAITQQLEQHKNRLDELEKEINEAKDNLAKHDSTVQEAAAAADSVKWLWIVAGLIAGAGVFFLLRFGSRTEIAERLDSVDDSLKQVITNKATSLPPYIEELEPKQGPVTGDIDLTIKGRNFDGTTDVRIGDRSCAIRQRDYGSITVGLPSAEDYRKGEVKLVVKTQYGEAARQFLYTKADLPDVTEKVPANGGMVLIKGDGFTAKTTVHDDSNICTTGYVSPYALIVDIPPKSGAQKTRNLTIKREDGASSTLTVNYT